jgi:hypothetical protein
MRICAHCGEIWFGKRIAGKCCEFGASYDAVWVYDGFLRAFVEWVKQRPKVLIRWAQKLRTTGKVMP